MKIYYNTILLLCMLTISQMNANNRPEKSSPADNTIKIIELASGYILSRSIHIATKIKVADYLVNGAQRIDFLAEKTEMNEQALLRLMSFLASHAIFYHHENDMFSLTPLAMPLISHGPDSLWPWITHHHDENRWTAYSKMEYSIKNGTPSFDYIFGKNYFDLIAQDPLLSNNFDEGMKNFSTKENNEIASLYPFPSFSIVADIGGGTGGLITDIITKNATIKGIVFDLLHVKNAGQQYLQEHDMRDNVYFIESKGFFDPIPHDANIYLLKRIMHNWNDNDCIIILKNCYNAMNNNSRLLIIESILDAHNIRDIKKDIDIEMMVLFGGKERTKKDFLRLIENAGLELITIYPTTTMLSIIEVQKKR